MNIPWWALLLSGAFIFWGVFGNLIESLFSSKKDKDDEPEEADDSEIEDSESETEESSDDSEEDEPDRDCAFQTNWQEGDNGKYCWSCGAADIEYNCDKSICPYWKEHTEIPKKKK